LAAFPKFLTLLAANELAQQRKKERQWRACVVVRGMVLSIPISSIGTKPVFAFLVKWPCGQSCLRASENVFEYFFRLKKVFAPAA